MATMDMIKHAGGTPCGSLDVGGGASAAERIATALKLVLSDTRRGPWWLTSSPASIAVTGLPRARRRRAMLDATGRG